MTTNANDLPANETPTSAGIAHPVRQAPGPQEPRMLGHLPAVMRKGMLRFVVDAWRAYGDVFRMKLGTRYTYVLTRPEQVKYVLAENRRNYNKGAGYKNVREGVMGKGLLTSEGEFWQRQRKLIQPLFTAKAVTQYAAEMTSTVEDMLARWQPRAQRGETLEIAEEMAHLTLSIIGRTMVSLDVGDETLAVGRACRAVLDHMANRRSLGSIITRKLPTPAKRRYQAAVHTLDTAVYQLIQERRTRQERPADLLTRLIDARDEETGEGMSNQQIHDELLTIFFAGHETTALALTWVWYLLATHPEAEEKLHAELATVLGARAPTVDDLTRLPYTRMVFEEAMRLYPPVWVFPREALEDDELDSYHVPAGSLMLLCPYITHRHPDLWEQPDEFTPEHFSQEHEAARPPYVYYPFGAGPRTCLGIHFAMLEGQLILAMVAQRYRLRSIPGFAPKPAARITLRPTRGMPMTLHPLLEQK